MAKLVVIGYYEEARATPTTVSGFPEDSKVVSVAAGLLHTCRDCGGRK